MRLTAIANLRRAFSENVPPRLQPGIFAMPSPRLRGSAREIRFFSFLLFCFFVLTASSAHAEYVVLKSGQRIVVTGYQLVGDTYKVTLKGGYAELPASEVVAIEPEEVFRSEQKPTFPDIPYG